MNCSAKTLALMEELTQAIGVSGQELPVCRILKERYAPLCDEIIRDYNGSIYAVKKGTDPHPFRVMVAAHSDEVGLVVQKICDNGLLRAHVIGGLFQETLPGSRLRLLTDDLKEFYGCISMDSPKRLLAHGRDHEVSVDDVYLDFGFTSGDQAKEMGIAVGNPVVLDGPFSTMADGQRLVSKAWDDRFGCILGIELLEKLKDISLPFDLYVGANVQEEVGLRGATTASNMIEPDLAIVLDCTGANDAQRFEEPFGGIGHGVMVRFTDRTYLPNRPMYLDYIATLEANKIPYQLHKSPGGTDAGNINLWGKGVPTITACICARNVHTANSVIDAGDYLHCLQAVTAFVQGLDATKLEKYRNRNI